MFQSKLFTKTRKNSPKDEVSKNADLLIRGGFIHKEMAGVYSYLPLGLKVLNNINSIIRYEMNKINGQEVLLTTLQDKNIWQTSDRWSDENVDNWFKSKFINGTEVGLGWTHEEEVTSLMKEFIKSYKDLPVLVFQIQNKFRNEKRAKSGIMRGKEFLMKDLYSFSSNEKEHEEIYEKIKKSYLNIFKKIGLGNITYLTFSSGGSFSKYSHEFQSLTLAGEDIIYLNKKKKVAINKEVYNDEVVKDLGLKKSDLTEEKAVEVGNIFSLGTRFSRVFDLNYLDKNGEKKLVIMGSYGIGPGRLLGAIVEILSDEKGIVWPKSISPFDIHLIEIGGEKEIKKKVLDLYKNLSEKGFEVLYDDRDKSAGEKFSDSDLIGIPIRLVVSAKTLKEKKIELKIRNKEKVEMIYEKDLFKKLKEY